MKKNKINKKACTNCGLEAAVARKVCSGCNTPFYSKRPTYFYETSDSAGNSITKGETSTNTAFSVPLVPNSNSVQTNSNSGEESNRRRTERVKREKPHFYDASEFQNKSKKKKNDKNNIKTTSKQIKGQAAQIKKKEKKRAKELKSRDTVAEIEDENIYESIMTERKAQQLAIILQELNNKLTISSWKP